MPEASILHDNIIHQEMMSHPALFSHPHPQKVVVIGDETDGILQETLKHNNVSQVWQIISQPTKNTLMDKKVTVLTGKLVDSLAQIEPGSIDILVNTQQATVADIKNFFSLLHEDGMLIQQSDSPFHLHKLKVLRDELTTANFSDIHFLSFSQPNFTSGWRTAVMAIKNGNFKRIREKDIFNKPFTTRYYNFDVHKASLVLPEFMREELEPLNE